VTGGWNPARLMVTGIKEPVQAWLVIDGTVRHAVTLNPEQWTELMLFIPHEQPVVSLSGAGLEEMVKSSAALGTGLRTVGMEYWPGMLVNGAEKKTATEQPLGERAPGLRFVEVELGELTRLGNAYLAQFPVVMLETTETEGVPRNEFMRLTEWVSSRTLVIPPGSKVRGDWPGLETLKFEEVYGYEVLNRGVLDVLCHPRVKLVDGEIGFFGAAGEWTVRMRQGVLVTCLGLLLAVSAFYVLVEARARGPLAAVIIAATILGVLLTIGASVLKVHERTAVVSDMVLSEGTAGSTVVLERHFRQIAGSPGLKHRVDADAVSGWVPVYRSEREFVQSVFELGPWAGEGMPEVWVRNASGKQVLVSSRTRLIGEPLSGGWMSADKAQGEASVPDSLDRAELALRVENGKWRPDRETPAEEVRQWVQRETGGILDARFLDWWSRRAPEGTWRMRFRTEPNADGANELRVEAVLLN